MSDYSSRDVAQLLGISVRQVYRHARAGFIKPARGIRRAYQFSFQDLVLIRAARALADARISPRRVRRALRRLVRELPEGHPLGDIRITAEEGRIVARDGTREWNPESGQLQLELRAGRRVKRKR
ncbi:MAG: helix-turn-helix domain-containing protein [Gemmatimonadota bacterium]